MTIAYWHEHHEVSQFEADYLRPIRPTFEMSSATNTLYESDEGKVGALGFLIFVFVLLICAIDCVIGYCYHKSAGEIQRQQSPVKKQKPFDFDEKEKEHLKAMAARERDLVEVDDYN